MDRLVTAHFLSYVLRLMFAALACTALPVSHARWGESPGTVFNNGTSYVGILLGMTMWSIGAGAVYFVLGSVVQILFRRRIRYVIAWDMTSGIALLSFLIWSGIHAQYK